MSTPKAPPALASTLAVDPIEARLTELRKEHATGMQQIQAFQATLLRISGAIQVLEEVQAELQKAK